MRLTAKKHEQMMSMALLAGVLALLFWQLGRQIVWPIITQSTSFDDVCLAKVMDYDGMIIFIGCSLSGHSLFQSFTLRRKFHYNYVQLPWQYSDELCGR